MTVVATRGYVRTARRADDDGDGSYQFYSRAEGLDNNVISTGTPVGICKAITSENEYYLSKANEHFLDKTGLLSYFIFFLWGTTEPTWRKRRPGFGTSTTERARRAARKPRRGKMLTSSLNWMWPHHKG